MKYSNNVSTMSTSNADSLFHVIGSITLIFLQDNFVNKVFLLCMLFLLLYLVARPTVNQSFD